MSGWRPPRGILPLGGLLLGHVLPIPPTALAAAGLLVPVALRGGRGAGVAALLVAVLAGGIPATTAPPCPQGERVWVGGRVVVWEPRGDSVRVELAAVRIGGRPRQPATAVRTLGPATWGRTPPASWVAVPGHLRPDRGATNPGQAPGLPGGFLLATGSPIAGPGDPPRIPRLREAIADRVRSRLDPPTAALAEGMLFGRSRVLGATDREAFRRTGTLHLLAVSGLHVGLVALLLAGAFRPGGVRAAWVGAGLGATGYAVLAGGPPSAMRAAGIALLLALARLAGRTADLPAVLVVLLALRLAVDPAAGEDVGLRLSFLAVGGILFALDLAGRRGLLAPVAVSLGAQWGTLPVQVATFGALAPAALGPNLLAVPLAGVFLPAVILALLLESAGAPADLLWLGAAGAGHLLLAVVRQAASVLPFLPHLVTPPGTAQAAIPLVLVLWFGLSPRARRSVRWRRGGGGAALAATALLLAPWPAVPGPWVAFLDVGQGDASVIRFSGGAVWLVDAGDDRRGDAGRRVIRPFLRAARIRSLDAVVVTHRHRDHVGGLGSLLEAVPVARVYDAAYGGGRTAERTRSLLAAHGVPVLVPAPGDTLPTGGRATVVALHPPRDATGLARNLNDVSLVVRIEDGPLSVLFAGDLEEPGERVLLAAGRPLASDGLQVGHHGSDTSTGASFLAAVDPGWAVVSVGRDNRYGHPDPVTLARLRASGIRVHRTDRDGAVWVVARGDTLRFRLHPPRRAGSVVPP